MTKIILILTAISLFALSFTKKTKTFIPPGTVQINDTLFADECEITNFAWQEYEFFMKKKYGSLSKEHIASLPDTNCWREKLAYNEPYVKYYYRHVAYREYPVVGISYKQAKAYCKWRTERVKTFLIIKKDFKNQNFEYRLPSKVEWEMLAESSSNFLSNNGKNDKGKYNLNCIHMIDSAGVKKCDDIANPDITAPVSSYYKNWFGIYNMLGNVSEMVIEEGISKGGSWRNRIEGCRVGKDLEYNKPTAWLGFRCVCIKQTGKNI
jgi:formylglycine-generating enzyme required for sulfatase activity